MLSRAPAAVDKAPADESEALAALALEYRARSVRFINARPVAGQGAETTGGALEAAETVLWFCSRIYFTTTRALVGKALTAAGQPDRGEDASLSAAQTLVAVDRSRAALQQLPDEDDERSALVALLDAIAAGIMERFPASVVNGRPVLQPLPDSKLLLKTGGRRPGSNVRATGGGVQEKSPPHR